MEDYYINRIDYLKEILKFDHFIHEIIPLSSFLGGLLSSKKLPFSNEHIYYKDKLTKCEVLVFGQIYSVDNNKEERINECAKFILSSYLSFGTNFIQALNGDFVIIIFDPHKKKVFLIRDHLGVQPLAFLVRDQTICFSSDVISLCRVFHNNDKINSHFLVKNFNWSDYKETPNPEVKKLLPGHFLEFSPSGFHIQKYWYPEKIKTDKSLSFEKMLKEMKELVTNAVAIRCDNRYNGAAHLSGGLDSGIVAALARKSFKNQTKFFGFSWSPLKETADELEFDERHYVNEQCQLNDIKPVFVSLRQSDYLEYNSQIINNSHFFEENKVLEEAKKRNINLILTGHGGDEFISKNHGGIDTDLILKLQFRSFLKKNPINKPRAFSSRLLYDIFLPYFNILPKDTKKHFKRITKYLTTGFNKINPNVVKQTYFYKSRRKLQLGYLYRYHLTERMEDWYVNGARNGIIYRYPLLDKKIVEYSLKIPSKLLFRDQYSRIILRLISKDLLPDNIRWRENGNDPVLRKYVHKNIISYSNQFIKDINEFEKNADLSFFDFNKIKIDINKYMKEKDQKEYIDLLFTIFNVKQLHEFSKTYHDTNFNLNDKVYPKQ